MIGIFDSGLGGLTILREIERALPQYSYRYLGDNARAPYGSRDPKDIAAFTREGVAWLFGRGAELTILACNTASAVALRDIQREWLPVHFPERRVLGIVVPTVEVIPSLTRTGVVGVLGTEATITSGVYPREVAKIDSRVTVVQQACPQLAQCIESGVTDERTIGPLAERYLGELFHKNDKVDTILLGCTHYPVLEEHITAVLPAGVWVVSQGTLVAERLKDYLARHPEVEQRLEKGSARECFTTGDPAEVGTHATVVYGSPVKFQRAVLR